jgi:hypothetical protein
LLSLSTFLTFPRPPSLPFFFSFLFPHLSPPSSLIFPLPLPLPFLFLLSSFKGNLSPKPKRSPKTNKRSKSKSRRALAAILEKEKEQEKERENALAETAAAEDAQPPLPVEKKKRTFVPQYVVEVREEPHQMRDHRSLPAREPWLTQEAFVYSGVSGSKFPRFEREVYLRSAPHGPESELAAEPLSKQTLRKYLALPDPDQADSDHALALEAESKTLTPLFVFPGRESEEAQLAAFFERDAAFVVLDAKRMQAQLAARRQSAFAVLKEAREALVHAMKHGKTLVVRLADAIPGAQLLLLLLLFSFFFLFLV